MSPRVTNWARIRSVKDKVDTRRVNREKRRHDLAQAIFVSIPRLRRQDGSYKLPK